MLEELTMVHLHCKSEFVTIKEVFREVMIKECIAKKEP